MSDYTQEPADADMPFISVNQKATKYLKWKFVEAIMFIT